MENGMGNPLMHGECTDTFFPATYLNPTVLFDKKYLVFVILILVGTLPLAAEPTVDLYAPGSEVPYVSPGCEMNASLFNPAVLGTPIRMIKGKRIVPYYTSFSAGYWSDKLALTPYREFLSLRNSGQLQRLVARLINESFGVAGKSAGKTSESITDKVKGGLSLFGGSDMLLLGMSLNKIAVDVRVLADVQIDLPDAPFLILFSEDDGLRRGADLSLSHMGAQMQVTTDITVSYGGMVDLSRITEKCNEFTGFSDFNNVSWGLGLTTSLGNCLLDLKTNDGGVRLNNDGTEMQIDADMNLKTSGAGLSGSWQFESPLEKGARVVGTGMGITTGVLLYGEHTSIGIALRRLGFMYWKDVQEADILIRTRPLSAVDLFTAELTEKGYDLFDSTEGGYFPKPEKGDSLKHSRDLIRWQPARVNIGFGYHIDCNKNSGRNIAALTRFVTATFEYEQSLIRWPGRSFLPRVTFGVENGFLWGGFPVYVELILGGAEKVASSAGFTVGMRYFHLQFGYQAVGTPYWYPKRGMKATLGLCTEWIRRTHPEKKCNAVKNKDPYTEDTCDYTKDETL